MATGFLKFDADHTIYIDLDLSTEEVEKAVIIDSEGNETSICGGGGTSVFDTVTMTLTKDETTPPPDYIEMVVPHFVDESYVSPEIFEAWPDSGDVEITVVIGPDGAVMVTNGVNMEASTGDIEYDEVNSCYIITGDCTVVLEGSIS